MPVSIHDANRAALGCMKSGGMTTRIGRRKRDFTGSCLTVVFAALAVSRWIEAEASWSFRKFVKTSRCNVTTGIRVGRQAVTTAGPLRAAAAKYPELSRAAAGVRTSLGELGNFFANLFGGTCLWMSMTTGSWRQ